MKLFVDEKFNFNNTLEWMLKSLDLNNVERGNWTEVAEENIKNCYDKSEKNFCSKF